MGTKKGIDYNKDALALFRNNVKERGIPRGKGYNDWYLDNIERQLNGLAKALPHMEKPAHKKEAQSIAFELSQLPKIEGDSLWYKYSFVQDRLMELKKMVGVGAKKGIDYNRKQVSFFKSWSGC